MCRRSGGRRSTPPRGGRSEERRVGKECRSRWSPNHEKKNGFAVWFYTLFLPSFMDTNTAGLLLLQQGPFGIAALRPQALFGADLPPLMHGVLWSLSLNILAYIVLSLLRQPS